MIACTRPFQSNMFRTILLPALLCASLGIAQQGQFPDLVGETADGQRVELPTPDAKEYTVIGLAFSQKASPMLEDWYEPAYLRLVAKHGLFASAIRCKVYFLPVFTGLNKSAYDPSMKKFRKSATPDIVGHVVFTKAELETLKGPLDLKDKDIPYFFILDRSGRIVHRTEGKFSEAKLDAIEAVLLEAE